jgi:hypothetical protein
MGCWPNAANSSEFYRAPSSCLWRHPAGAISFQGHTIRHMPTDVGPRWALFGLRGAGEVTKTPPGLLLEVMRAGHEGIAFL